MPGAGLVAASLALAGLAACGVASIYGEYFDHAYAPTELSAGAGEALYVEVIGVPPAAGEADAGEVGRFIVRALEEGAPGWLQTEFTTDAAEADDPDYRIRVIFDPPPGLTLIRACEETRSDARPVRDRPLPTVVMAICRHGRVFSAVEGSLGATASFDANRDEIARLLGFAAQVALPTRNPLPDEDCPTAVVCN